MNAKHILQRALVLLNYVDANGQPAPDAAIGKRAVGVINQIAADLTFAADPDADFVPIARLDEDVALDGRIAHGVMPYGVAMLLAQSEGDADNQAVFAAIYNRKRAAAGGFAQRRLDVLPK